MSTFGYNVYSVAFISKHKALHTLFIFDISFYLKIFGSELIMLQENSLISVPLSYDQSRLKHTTFTVMVNIALSGGEFNVTAHRFQLPEKSSSAARHSDSL